MQTWKKKLVVSQLALACTLAIASQANAKDISGTTYNTLDMIIQPPLPGIFAIRTGMTLTLLTTVIFIRDE